MQAHTKSCKDDASEQVGTCFEKAGGPGVLPDSIGVAIVHQFKHPFFESCPPI